MTESEWNICADPGEMLEFLRGKVGERKPLWFAVSCVRACLPFKQTFEQSGEEAVEVMEAFLDGRTSSKEHEEAKGWYGLRESEEEVVVRRETIFGHYLCEDLLRTDPWEAARSCAGQLYQAARHEYFKEHRTEVGFQIQDVDKGAQDVAVQLASILRDIIGNPFNRVTINPAWLSSNVVELARAVYDEREFDRMAILGDALEDTGCDSAEILNHCRGENLHVRGCWCLDLILNKQ